MQISLQIAFNKSPYTSAWITKFLMLDFNFVQKHTTKRESLQQIFKEYDELQKLVKLNSKFREDFAVLEIFTNLAVEN